MLNFITHKLAHRDGEIVERWNPDLRKWERWMPILACWIALDQGWRPHYVDQVVSYNDTFAEPIYAD